MNGVLDSETDYSSQYVEVDPTGRYGRYDDVLGKGASKTVYKGFDEYQGIEVAWNQVKLHDFLRNPEDLERLYCEIHLLKTLKHKNIMKFHTSWVDASNRNINFVTEMFTSGTLRQFRLKHRKVNVRAVKQWCRQILRGLVYLHSHDPPVLHRDLKCDNIFINGNQGEVKIGDLGLAGFLRKSHADHCVGTPEFMAPEVYEEEYNELVDIYSFGMCILEMVTLEYPYSECTTPAQIYKKVISGIKPEALYKVKDEEVREFVGKCLATLPNRLSAKDLLKDRFLQIEDYETFIRETEDIADFEEVGPLLRQSLYQIDRNCDFLSKGFGNRIGFALENEEIKSSEIDIFSFHEDDHVGDVDITIKGRRREDDGIFLRLRIVDQGRVRNIYFPFDLETDTGLSVASEMVAELDITDQDVTKIADMINGEISTLVPDWKTELSGDSNIMSLCHNCASNSSVSDYISSHKPCSKTLQVLRCSKDGCASVHGRFEEIMYQVEGSEKCLEENLNQTAERSVNYADIWAQRDGPECKFDEKSEKEGKTIDQEKQAEINEEDSFSSNQSVSFAFSDDYENEIRQELRWLKAKYQMQLRELKNQQLRAITKRSSLNRNLGDLTFEISPSVEKIDRGRPFIDVDDKDSGSDSFKLEFRTSKSFYTAALNSLHRATSLPVDAVHV